MRSYCASVMDKVCKKSLKMFEQGHTFVIADTSEEDRGDESPRVLVNKNFVKHLQIVMEPFQSKCHLSSLSILLFLRCFLADSLKLFSAVNFLTNACRRTERGVVHPKIYVEQEGLRHKSWFCLSRIQGLESESTGISISSNPLLSSKTAKK